jgi:two-component system chemotaxis response regulator CheB
MHVLVVDDSAVVRQTVIALLQGLSGVTVSVAADPLIAMQKMSIRRPDVILLDLQMPVMDGLTFLRKLMSEDPIPVVVCSALTSPGTTAAMRALEEGAVDVVAKPRVGVRDFLMDSRTLLLDALRGAAAARVRRRQSPLLVPEPRLTADAVLPPRKPAPAGPSDIVIAVGASTGGTQALRVLLDGLGPTTPGLVIVQHIPEPFARALANRLNTTSPIEVAPAVDGETIVRGRAFVAPGDCHIAVRRDGNGYTVRLIDGPLVRRHRPSVDVLFRSVAQEAGANAIGVILTGMGDDGAEGLREMRDGGAFTIAQDLVTSVVFGMPKEAIARGGVVEVLPLENIARRITEEASRIRQRAS